MKAKRIEQPGFNGIAVYDARHFHSVLLDEDEARELIEELKWLLLDTTPSEMPTQSHDREPDARSREWVEARRLEAVADALSGDYNARFDRAWRRVVVAAGKIDDYAAYDAANALEDRLGDDYFVTWSRNDDGDVRLYVSVI